MDIYNKKPLLLLEAPKEQPKEQPKEEKKIDVENDAAMLPKTQIPKKQGPKINYLHYNPQHGL